MFHLPDSFQVLIKSKNQSSVAFVTSLSAGVLLQPSDAQPEADPGPDEGVLQPVPVGPTELPRSEEEASEKHEKPQQGREGPGKEALGQDVGQ